MKPETIINEVCMYFDTTYEEAKKASTIRKTKYVLVRYYCYLFLEELTILPLQDIGYSFDQNHSTVINALKKIKNWIETDKKKKEIYDGIKLKIDNAIESNVCINISLITKMKFRRLKNPSLTVAKHII